MAALDVAHGFKWPRRAQGPPVVTFLPGGIGDLGKRLDLDHNLGAVLVVVCTPCDGLLAAGCTAWLHCLAALLGRSHSVVGILDLPLPLRLSLPFYCRFSICHRHAGARTRHGAAGGINGRGHGHAADPLPQQSARPGGRLPLPHPDDLRALQVHNLNQ